jgi:rubredoxin
MPGTKKVSGSSGSKAGKRVVHPAKSPVPMKKAATQKTAAPAKKTTGIKKGKAGGKKTVKKSPKKKISVYKLKRYKCRLCGYIYSPIRGEPHNGIPAGTPFEDLPEDYVCPVCGYEGRGKIGTWGFDEWVPTRYICVICGYVYDEKRGEPHNGIKPGTKFEDLPDDYKCPVCAQDPKISVQFGKVLKQGFDALDD